MSFRGLLRPGQGFRPFIVFSRDNTLTETGRPQVGRLVEQGTFIGIISCQPERAGAVEAARLPDHAHHRAERDPGQSKATDVLMLKPPNPHMGRPRFFLVQESRRTPESWAIS